MGMGHTTRPTGISILAVLHILSGALGFIVIASLVAQFRQNPEALQFLNTLGLPPALFIFAIVLLFSLSTVSGIGMWKGKRWGWYLGSFYYLYSVVRNAITLITIPVLTRFISPEEFAEAGYGPSYYYVKYGGRVLVNLLIYLYFFKSNVREFFALAEYQKWKPVVIELWICVAIVVMTNVVARMISR